MHRSTCSFVDIGANLLDPMFMGIYREKSLHASDLVHVIQRARSAGAVNLFVTAGNVEESKQAIQLAREQSDGFLKTTVSSINSLLFVYQINENNLVRIIRSEFIQLTPQK